VSSDDAQTSSEGIVRKRSSVLKALRALLRTRIVAGLLTVVPIWVTWVVVRFVFDAMKSATEPIAWWFAKQVQPDAPLGLLNDKYLVWIVPLMSVVLTLFLLYTLGLMTASVFGKRLIMLFERIFERVPLVKQVYRSTKQIVLTLGGGEPHTSHFKRVGLVAFPHPGMKCIGFLTSVMTDVDTGRPMASIFISTTPNPTTGYMQIVPLEDVSETEWTVEEAVKLLMSGGILSPETVPFDKVHPVKWDPSEKKQDSQKKIRETENIK